jgi:acetyltransferase-like isoleucine patch superfamily enzyme
MIRAIGRILRIRQLFRSLFFRFVSIDEIILLIDEKKIRNCLADVTIGNRSFFHKQAQVINMLKDKSKIVIGDDTHIKAELLVFANGGKIKIGSNTFIGEGTRVWSANEISIGDNVLISHNCNIMDTNSHEINHIERADSFRKLVLHSHPKGKTNVLTKAVIIEEYVWISFGVTILKGVTIGKGAIIGAGSVVTSDVAPFTLVGGVPAKKLKDL